jgi:hypothetical protein
VVRRTVGFVGEGTDVDKCEDHHFKGLEEGGYANVDVAGCHVPGIFDNPERA